MPADLKRPAEASLALLAGFERALTGSKLRKVALVDALEVEVVVSMLLEEVDVALHITCVRNKW